MMRDTSHDQITKATVDRKSTPAAQASVGSYLMRHLTAALDTAMAPGTEPAGAMGWKPAREPSGLSGASGWRTTVDTTPRHGTFRGAPTIRRAKRLARLATGHAWVWCVGSVDSPGPEAPVPTTALTAQALVFAASADTVYAARAYLGACEAARDMLKILSGPARQDATLRPIIAGLTRALGPCVGPLADAAESIADAAPPENDGTTESVTA